MRNSLLVKFYPVEDLRDLNCLPNLQILAFLTLSEDPPAEKLHAWTDHESDSKRLIW